MATIVWAGWDDAVAAYKRGDYASAYKQLKPLAEQGNGAAQNNLGTIYKEGQGVPKDNAEAVKWFRKAAEQGFADAQNNLRRMHANGQGASKR
jgi:TPR repeat protein